MRTLFRKNFALALLALPMMACPADDTETDTDASATGDTTNGTSSTTAGTSTTSSTTSGQTSDTGETTAPGTDSGSGGGTVADSGSAGETAATGGTADTGGGACDSPEKTCTDAANCICLGCQETCLDMDDVPVSDCTCEVCAKDMFCSSADCGDGPDGVCDVFNEGCMCEDCADLPICG